MRLLNYTSLRDRGIPYTRVHLARLIKDNKFPKPVALSNKRIAWVETEIDEWLGALIEKRAA